MYKLLLLIPIVFIAFSVCAQMNHEYKIVKTYPIASPGGWDYIAVHEGKLYVSHATQVNILNEETGDSIGVIPNTTGVHGIAFDQELERGYTSNGRLNNVTVFDLKTNRVIGEIPAGQNPDAILYESFKKMIITCNGRSKDLSFIDPGKGITVTAIDVGGKPEEAISNGKGKLFVNIEDKNEIVTIDLNEMKVLDHWSLDEGKSPTGLAYDGRTKRLFAGCQNLLVILNAENGSLVAKIPIGSGCDGVVFNSKNNMVYTSNGDGTISVIKEINAGKFSLVGNYPTKWGARTIALDEENNALFLPAADFSPVKNEQTGRPTMIAGSFQVLVVK